MSLKEYQFKRDFARTPEPTGSDARPGKSVLRFVLQKHAASHLHYDFRLELDGALKSWAVPKGPSLDSQRKSLAVQVEDHPLDYGDFEGVISKGQYGGGTVLLWDKGTWEPLDSPREALSRGKLRFILHGQKLKGQWNLIQMRGKSGNHGKNWLLMKSPDEYANTDSDILAEEKQSVKTNRSMEQIAHGDKGLDRGQPDQGAKQPAELQWLKDFSPQLAVLVESAPSGEQWLHEIKFDGYRIIAYIKGAKVRLMTRNGNDWTNKFPLIARQLGRLKLSSAMVDGEVVMLDKEGRSDFQALQAMLKFNKSSKAVFFAFDLPFLNGEDLREMPLIERKEKLQAILRREKLTPQINYSEHVRGHGDVVEEKACAMALEGIISKRADAPYVCRRDDSWVKSKCAQRQEMVVIGYTEPQGKRSSFGALLLGYHDSDGQLVYAGRVGTGFDVPMLEKTLRQLKNLERDDSPTDLPVPRREQGGTHWVKPVLVAEVKFTGWTRDGLLRQPVFVAFRSDKPASQVVREKAVPPQMVEDLSRSNRQDSTGENLSQRSDAKNIQKESSASVAGVTLTHPNKVLYPDSKTDKRALAEYYTSVQKWMLPHIVHRPLALMRCPEGIGSKCFFQRNWSNTLPKTIGKVDVGDSKTKETHVAVEDLTGVISLVQVSVLEIHTWNCRAGDIERPDQLVFDLDPGPDVPWKRVIEAARVLNKTLHTVGLTGFLKTSGGKGLHITVPIKPEIDWNTAKSFCQTIAQTLAGKSDLFIANMRKDLRKGKVYLDYQRNDKTATAIAPYSTRARSGAAIAMPLAWEELGKIPSADHFKVQTVGRYLKKRSKNPWRDFEKSRVDILKLINKQAKA